MAENIVRNRVEASHTASPTDIKRVVARQAVHTQYSIASLGQSDRALDGCVRASNRPQQLNKAALPVVQEKARGRSTYLEMVDYGLRNGQDAFEENGVFPGRDLLDNFLWGGKGSGCPSVDAFSLAIPGRPQEFLVAFPPIPLDHFDDQSLILAALCVGRSGLRRSKFTMDCRETCLLSGKTPTTRSRHGWSSVNGVVYSCLHRAGSEPSLV